MAADAAPGLLSSSHFSIDFLMHAGIIWVALIFVFVVVFAFRKHGKHEKRGFAERYQEELDAMRKGGKD